MIPKFLVKICFIFKLLNNPILVITYLVNEIAIERRHLCLKLFHILFYKTLSFLCLFSRLLTLRYSVMRTSWYFKCCFYTITKILLFQGVAFDQLEIFQFFNSSFIFPGCSSVYNFHNFRGYLTTLMKGVNLSSVKWKLSEGLTWSEVETIVNCSDTTDIRECSGGNKPKDWDAWI